MKFKLKLYRILSYTVIGVALMLSAAVAETCPQYLTKEESSKLEKIVGNSKLVVFGEPSHGLRAVHCLNAETFRHLVESKGFRVIVFESAWGMDDGFRDFMQSDRKELTGEESFLLNAFNSPPTLDLLYYIRDHNRKYPKDLIHVAGFQPEQPVTDARAISSYASKAVEFSAFDLPAKTASCKAWNEEFPDDIAFIGFSSKRRHKEKLPTYRDEERKQCLDGLTVVEQFLEKNKRELIEKTSPAQFQEAILHVKSLRNYVGLLSIVLDSSVTHPNMTPAETLKQGHDTYEQGDAARFEVFQTLRQTRYQNMKIYLWMHDWHAAKHSDEIEYPENIPMGTVSFGTRLAKEYGHDLVDIGGIVGCPSCKEGVPADAIEKQFSDMFGNKTVLVDLRNPTAAEQKLPLNTAGSLWDQLYKDRLVKIVLRDQFDAVYYLPESKTFYEK
ncbi:MAG: erythromycin esterase family protein [Terriglobales bacterium]